MKQKLDALRGKHVDVFYSTPTNDFGLRICGTLIGGDLPGRPFGVELSNGHLDFKPEKVIRIEESPHQICIILNY